jgi:hypothetical protein
MCNPYSKEVPDAYSGPGDRDRDGLSRAGGSPEVGSGVSGLPAPIQLAGGQPLRSYTSLPQCNASASGRYALCEINPYFAGVGERGLSPASRRLLKSEPHRPPHHNVRVADPALSNLLGQAQPSKKTIIVGRWCP